MGNKKKKKRTNNNNIGEKVEPKTRLTNKIRLTVKRFVQIITTRTYVFLLVNGEKKNKYIKIRPM